MVYHQSREYHPPPPLKFDYDLIEVDRSSGREDTDPRQGGGAAPPSTGHGRPASSQYSAAVGPAPAGLCFTPGQRPAPGIDAWSTERTVPSIANTQRVRSGSGLALHGVAALAILTVTMLVTGCRSDKPPPPADTPGTDTPGVVASNPASMFAVGIVPTVAPPVAVGTPVSFRLSSSETGYGHLYMLSSNGGVTMLAENLPLAGGQQVDYPRADDGVTLRANPPVGIERLILLVTRQPFVGFVNSAGGAQTGPMALATTTTAFLQRFNTATQSLPPDAWAVAETRLEVIQ